MEDAIYDRDYNKGENKIRNERKDKLYEFAKNNNIDIKREYLDYNQYKRGNMMNKLLQDIEDGKVGTVIFSSLDRVSRNSMECLNILKRIENAGGTYLFADSRDKKVDKLMKVCDELELKIEKSKRYSEKLMESILKDSFKA